MQIFAHPPIRIGNGKPDWEYLNNNKLQTLVLKAIDSNLDEYILLETLM